jgi:hypothetical protein
MASSLASATSTRADSASRHMQACRVNFDALKAYAKDENDMINNKFKYCMHKDELAVSVSKPLMPGKHVSTSSKYPYPSVVTTLANIDIDAKAFMCYANHISSKTDYETLLEKEHNILTATASVAHVEALKEYTPVGYSVGLAYAHPNSGDNIAAVMVGGVVTVMNGAFEMRTGDMVQFYWDFEQNMFEDGNAARRIDDYSFADVKANIQQTNNSADSATKKRKTFYGKQANGMNKENRKENVAMIKPYIRHKGLQVFADNERVFAKAISSARAYEMVDILISRQAL